jgi:hypothetical protein
MRNPMSLELPQIWIRDQILATCFGHTLEEWDRAPRKIKLEGEHGRRPGFATPLYGKVPELSDGRPLFTKDFVEKYGLYVVRV